MWFGATADHVANQSVQQLSFVFPIEGSNFTQIVIGSEKWQGTREYGAGIKWKIDDDEELTDWWLNANIAGMNDWGRKGHWEVYYAKSE